MPCIIAIDLGTTHSKALVLDEKATVLHHFKLPVTSVQLLQGQHQQEAADIFEQVLELLTQCLQAVPADNISCICFSAAMHSLLAVDENGHTLTMAYTWADTQSKAVANRLRQNDAAKNVYEITGTPLHAMSPLVKIIWLKETQPEMFNAAYKFISIKEYVLWQLVGKYIVDEGIASATGLYDAGNKQWSTAALSLAGIDTDRLSEVASTFHKEKLQMAIMQRLGLQNSIPVVIGGNDGCLANLGCGALNATTAALTIGTSGAIRVTIPAATMPPPLHGLFRYVLTDALQVTGGPINNGGIVLQWFAKNFMNGEIQSAADFEALMQLASTAPAGSDGLLFLPYLLGERAPVWDETAQGMFYGITLQHTKAHFARAVIEGISFALLQILTAIEKNNSTVTKIFTSGMATQSNWWMQLLADMFGKTVVLSDATDASALGAAFIAMYAMQMIPAIEQVNEFITISKQFKPDSINHVTYQELFTQYCTLYQRMQ
jgi:gluconokinase